MDVNIASVDTCLIVYWPGSYKEFCLSVSLYVAIARYTYDHNHPGKYT